MNKKILLSIVLVVAFGITYFSLFNPIGQSNADLSYEMKDQVAKESLILDGNIDSASTNSINKPSESKVMIPFDFDGDLGELVASSLIITPLEKYEDGIGLTFNLDVYSEKVKVIVLDDLMRLVNEYVVAATSIEVVDSSGIHSVYVYKTSLSGLRADSSYHYVIQYDKAYSKAYNFTTFSDKEPTTMAFYGDTQGYLNSQYEAFRKTYDIAESIAEEVGHGIDLNYIAGDLVDDGGNYDQWKFFYNNVKDVFSQHQFISAIGNHDVYNGPGPYVNAFNYPENGVEGLKERSFYVDLPYARVAVFDTESILTYSQQSKWLLEVMSEAKQAFKIVLMHRSVYPMAYNEAHIRRLADLFEAADIDLVLSGHDHIYSRTTMESDTQVDIDKGVTYMVVGSSTGSKFYESLDESSRYWKNVAYDEDYPVFTLLEIGEDRIEVKAYSIKDDEVTVIDSFQLYD